VAKKRGVQEKARFRGGKHEERNQTAWGDSLEQNTSNIRVPSADSQRSGLENRGGSEELSMGFEMRVLGSYPGGVFGEGEKLRRNPDKPKPSRKRGVWSKRQPYQKKERKSIKKLT